MDQAPSGRNVEVVKMESSTSGTPFTLKAAIRKLAFRFRTSRVPKQLGPPLPSLASSAVYSSPRIERMMQTRSDFSTELEFEIESSKDHWSEVVPLSDDSELVPQDPQAFIEQGIFAGDKDERLLSGVRYLCDVSVDSRFRERELLVMLTLRWPFRFIRRGDRELQWEVGRKLGEGAQAEIFEAIPGPRNKVLGSEGKYILKVFREGSYARDLQRVWPKQLVTGYVTSYTCPIRRGMLLDNGRFAFMMPRYWGDLRKLLDQRMQERLDCTCPPCSDWEATRSMLYIAKGMRDLHTSDIVHRDLKASNVLVEMIERSVSEMEEIGNKEVDKFYCRVADFESSKAVLGTRFWRAPEILLGVKRRCVTPNLFTKASDVYSYAMTCYEIWTGCVPFENLKNNDYDYVIGGERPTLPRCVEPWIQEMLERCWHGDPCQRPTFQEICDTIAKCTKEKKSSRRWFSSSGKRFVNKGVPQHVDLERFLDFEPEIDAANEVAGAQEDGQQSEDSEQNREALDEIYKMLQL